MNYINIVTIVGWLVYVESIASISESNEIRKVQFTLQSIETMKKRW